MQTREPSVEPSIEQMEEQQSKEHPVSDNEEEPAQPTNADVTVTKSPRKGKRTAKRKSTAQPKEKQTIDPSGDQQNVEKTAEDQQNEEPPTRKSLRTRKGRSHTDLISRANSVNIELNPDIVNSVLETKIESDFKGICLYLPFLLKMKAHRKKPRTEPTTEAIPEYRASSSQPQDKRKAPAIEEETEEEDDDDEDKDTEEEDPA
nr:nucleolin-like [Coffea arabica]